MRKMKGVLLHVTPPNRQLGYLDADADCNSVVQ